MVEGSTDSETLGLLAAYSVGGVRIRSLEQDGKVPAWRRLAHRDEQLRPFKRNVWAPGKVKTDCRASGWAMVHIRSWRNGGT